MNKNGYIPFCNPATGEQFGSVPVSTPRDVERAMAEMRVASAIWRRKPIKERIRILRKFQKLMIDHTDDISAIINQDTGKSRQDGLAEVMMTADKLHQYYRHAPKWLARRSSPRHFYIFKRYFVERQPYGVVGIIGAWNYPFDLTVPQTCSALLAGNTVLVKPSEVAAATGVLVEKLFQSVPELSPFVRVLHGGPETGAAMVQAQPDLIFLTGSVATGKKVSMAAAEHLIPVITELGGKDPMIVLKDANADAAAYWAVKGAYYNSGQTCVAIERVYVVEDVYDEFVQKAVTYARATKMGYSSEKSCPYYLGPLTFDRQIHIIEEHLDDAMAKGARVLAGGQRDGLYMEPTVLVDVNHEMKIMRDETFGPILAIMKVKDEEEAIRLANDSEFGLSGAVWSEDIRQAERVAQQLEVGAVVINDTLITYPVSLLPFGGVKKSGTARVHGKEEVTQFTQIRSYAVGKTPHALDMGTWMRQPGNYWIGRTGMHLLFGVTPQQRVKPLVEEAQRLAGTVKESPVGAAVSLGAVAGLAALVWSALRGQK